ncbi:hypothetical protein AVEN_110225-1 [Araneus ventricosus]|uniref:Uncharacterized protein n=1 Tax=Araneus ventricosus TaxID=182803 RepID=A0A4Y2TP42_ARAVE|nr:hypothetical protein AVEN_110225-1 [Araneus ventricosus]
MLSGNCDYFLIWTTLRFNTRPYSLVRLGFRMLLCFEKVILLIYCRPLYRTPCIHQKFTISVEEDPAKSKTKPITKYGYWGHHSLWIGGHKCEWSGGEAWGAQFKDEIEGGWVEDPSFWVAWMTRLNGWAKTFNGVECHYVIFVEWKGRE